MCRPSGVDAGAQCVDAAHGIDSAIGAEVVLRQSAVAADDCAARVLSKQFDGSVFVGNCDAGGDGASTSSLLTNNNEATIRADDQTTSSHRIPNLNRNIIMNIEPRVDLRVWLLLLLLLLLSYCFLLVLDLLISGDTLATVSLE